MLQPRANQPKDIFGNPGVNNNINVSVKIPELFNIALNNDTVPDSILEYLLFEQVSSQELLLVSRSDMLNGQSVNYNVISNLPELASDYSPANIMSLPNALPDLFKNFGIPLENYVPALDKAIANRLANESPNAYVDIDDTSNNYNSIIVEFKNLQSNYSVEVQVMSSGLVDDTAYDFVVV